MCNYNAYRNLVYITVINRLRNRIREERLKLGLTQEKLAEDIEISNSYMEQIERGERSLTLGTLVKVVNRLGALIDYLLTELSKGR